MPVKLKADKPLFALLCKEHGIPVPTPEFRFHADRQWRFDYCWINERVALEVQGGIWSRGRHVRGKGYLNDIEKMNEAQILGWMLLQCTPQDIETGRVFELLRRVL